MCKRQELGIACYKPAFNHLKGKTRPNFNWTEEAIALIGTVTDVEAGERLGLSPGAVSLNGENWASPANQ